MECPRQVVWKFHGRVVGDVGRVPAYPALIYPFSHPQSTHPATIHPLVRRNAELVTSLGYHVARGDGDKAARAQADRRDGRDAPAGRAQSVRAASKPL